MHVVGFVPRHPHTWRCVFILVLVCVCIRVYVGVCIFVRVGVGVRVFDRSAPLPAFAPTKVHQHGARLQTRIKQ